MSTKSEILNREEALALMCALAITAVLSMYSLYLKRQDASEIAVSLAEYAEPFSVPRSRADLAPRGSGRAPASSSTRGSLNRVAVDSIETPLTEPRFAPLPDAMANAGVSVSDSASMDWSPVFRPTRRAWELDSIFKVGGEAGASLLREHLFHESRVYDTLLTSHLLRLGNEFRRFDATQSLESESMFNMGRYGSPYNPLRPQPPSAQVPVKGVVIWVLGFLYKQASEVPNAVTRMMKPGQKQPTE